MFQLVSFLSGKAQVRSRGQSARAMPPHPTPIEWYPQILQNKQNVHIILQQLCPPFPRGKIRGEK